MNKAEAILAGLSPEQVEVTKADLSRIWGISKSAVTQIFRNPQAPIFNERNKIRLCDANRYYATVSRAASRRVEKTEERYAEEVMTLQEAKRRQAVCELRLSQMRVAEAEGRLVSREEYRTLAANDAALVAQSLRGLSSKVAAELVDAATTGGVQAVGALLDRRITELLRNLAQALSDERKEGMEAQV